MPTSPPTDADLAAAFELALDMTWTEAVKFIRAESGYGFMESVYKVQVLARSHPTSVLGVSFSEHEAKRRQEAKPHD